MQTSHSPGRFVSIIISLILFSLCITVIAYAQVKDSSTGFRSDTVAMSPLKKQVSDVARILAQQPHRTLSFDNSSSIRCRIEKSAPLYKLPGAESTALLLALPNYTHEYLFSITSMVHGFGTTWYIFSPMGVFLDSSFRPTHLLPDNQFRMVSAGQYSALSLKTEVRINNERSMDKYLLLYTRKSGERLSNSHYTLDLSPGFPNFPVIASQDGKLEFEIHQN